MIPVATYRTERGRLALVTVSIDASGSEVAYINSGASAVSVMAQGIPAPRFYPGDLQGSDTSIRLFTRDRFESVDRVRSGVRELRKSWRRLPAGVPHA